MGGKSGGPLASWIKEFATLVFVQSIHAFIFAVIMILIMSTMDPAKAPSADDYNTGVGLMCIIALTSLFKIEEMIRKIFGISNTKADHGNALKSIAKTAVALKIGKRVLDNGKKFTGGVKKIRDSKQEANTVKKRYQEDLNDLGIKGALGSSTQPQKAAATSTQQQVTPQKTEQKGVLGEQDYLKKAIAAKNDGDMDKYREYRGIQAGLNKAAKADVTTGKLDNQEYMKKAMEAKKDGDMGKYREYRGIQAGLNKAAKANIGSVDLPNSLGEPKMNDNIGKPTNTISSASGESIDFDALDPRTKQKLRALQRTQADKIKELKKKRNEGIKDIAKSIAESGGAVIGGTAGAILGGADGDLEGAFQGLASGAGLGDAAGEFTVDSVYSAGKFSTNRIKETADFSKDVTTVRQGIMQDVKAEGKARIKEQVKAEIKGLESATEKRVGSIRKLEKNYKEIEKFINDSEKKSTQAYRSSVDDA